MIQPNWNAFEKIMAECPWPREIVTQPQNYREQQHSAIRVAVVREMAVRGHSVEEIEKVCPLSVRSLKRICQ